MTVSSAAGLTNFEILRAKTKKCRKKTSDLDLVLVHTSENSPFAKCQLSRDFQQRRRRRQRERQKSNRFIEQNNQFARASRFFVHFFAVTARLRRENAQFHELSRTQTSDDKLFFLFLNFFFSKVIYKRKIKLQHYFCILLLESCFDISASFIKYWPCFLNVFPQVSFFVCQAMFCVLFLNSRPLMLAVVQFSFAILYPAIFRTLRLFQPYHTFIFQQTIVTSCL